MTMPAIEWPEYLQDAELRAQDEGVLSRSKGTHLKALSTAAVLRFSGANDEDILLDSPNFESTRGRDFAERGFVRMNRPTALRHEK